MTVKREIVVRYRAQTYDIPLDGSGGGQDRMEDTLAVHYLPVVDSAGGGLNTTIAERPVVRIPTEWTDGVRIEAAYFTPLSDNTGVQTGAYGDVIIKKYSAGGGAGTVVARERAQANLQATGGTQGYTGATAKLFDYVATGTTAELAAGDLLSFELAQVPAGSGASMPPYMVDVKLREL